MKKSPWGTHDLPAQAGRTVVVTGANSGLGLVTARELARVGARVVLAVRDLERGAQAASTMSGQTEVRRLDLADLASVREFAAGLGDEIDVLVNNAGVMAIPLRRTADGFEMQFGTNHLGHFALTNLLLPQITDRIVTVASVMHRVGRIRFDDPNWKAETYRRWPAYGQSKLANLLFTLELQRRLTAADSKLRALAAHPGYASTNLQSHSSSGLELRVMALGNRYVAQSEAIGALPTLYAATQDLPGNAYIGPGGFAEQSGHPAPASRTKAARDAAAARRLWDLSERLTGVPFPLSSARP